MWNPRYPRAPPKTELAPLDPQPLVLPPDLVERATEVVAERGVRRTDLPNGGRVIEIYEQVRLLQAGRAIAATETTQLVSGQELLDAAATDPSDPPFTADRVNMVCARAKVDENHGVLPNGHRGPFVKGWDCTGNYQ